MPRWTRMVVILLLAAVPASTVAFAQAPAFSAARPLLGGESAYQGLFARFWSILTQPWGKNGCSVDPDGLCQLQAGTSSGDNGCQVDPSGRCLQGKRLDPTKNGCSVDPSGQCLHGKPSAQTKNGCQVDPNGRCIP
jgi:hypothetical protein